jgi:hypothetical protein
MPSFTTTALVAGFLTQLEVWNRRPELSAAYGAMINPPLCKASVALTRIEGI